MAETLQKKNIFRFSNITLWSFIAMVVGAILGLLIPNVMTELVFIGDIWINCIKMIIVPLILCIVTLAIATQEDLHTLGRVAVEIMIYYVSTSVFAVALGLGVSWLVNPARGITLQGLESVEVESVTADLSIQNFISSMFSGNIFESFSSGDMLQTMVFAILLGIALVTMKEKHKKYKDAVIHGLEAINEAINNYLRLMIKFTPIAVLFLIGDSFANYGMSILTSMVGLIGTFWLCIAIMFVFVYGIILWSVSGINPFSFVKKTSEVWMFAFASCASAACLPIEIKNARETWKVPDYISNFCLTLGSQLNSHGAAMLYGCVLVFIKEMYDLPMSFGQILQILLVATLIASSGGGIPSGGIVKLSILVSTFGLPAEIVGIMAGFWRFFDMGTTAGNALGDLAGAVTVAKFEERRAKKLGIPFGDNNPM